eukprot:261067-Pelagomonas_calceolata.AAC.1
MAVSEPSLADNVQGAVTGASDVRVMHMLYADDLCPTASHPTELQIMLDRLHGYAQKGLTINVSSLKLYTLTQRAITYPLLR